jgi:hypothetical protein
MDPDLDPGGPKTYGSGGSGSGFGSGSATLLKMLKYLYIFSKQKNKQFVSSLCRMSEKKYHETDPLI